ncbi:MAG: hypothetical protein LBD31_02980 [Treponema sp.]|jgi:hypothetical protein|nr:hypothetical protein [Treponema sp.]
MSITRDWLSHTREGQLAMARDWLEIIGSGGKAAAWGIPPATLTALETRHGTAQGALITAENETTRTLVATAQCRESFAALTELMRDIKKRYYLTPPLAESDYVSLGLKPHDTTPTPSGTPTAQVTIETFLVGRHELGVKIIYVTGNPHDPANKGYRIWYKIVAPGAASTDATAPTGPEDLPKSFYTKRKKDVIEFDFGDSGKTAYFAVQIENEGRKGPWGPLVSALIP